MIGKFVKGRVCVFIDAANIFYSQKTLGWSINFQKLKSYFVHECKSIDLNFYTGKIGDNPKQAKFLSKLEDYGYKITSKEVKIIWVSENAFQRKGSLDAEIIIDALNKADQFDTFVLMSGDSDFAPLLDELKKRGKRVIVMSTKRHVSRELIERAKYVNLKKLRKELDFKDKKVPPIARGEVRHYQFSRSGDFVKGEENRQYKSGFPLSRE